MTIARKLAAYAAGDDPGFTMLPQPDGGVIVHPCHPQGIDLRLTATEAELWLSGYVTGRHAHAGRDA